MVLKYKTLLLILNEIRRRQPQHRDSNVCAFKSLIYKYIIYIDLLHFGR